MSAFLLVGGLVLGLGATSLELGRERTREEALSPYARESWGGGGESGRGLATVLYLGHLVGPMLLLAALVHARLRFRELADSREGASADADLLPPPTAEDAPRTLRRISVVLPRTEALSLLEQLVHPPAHAHRAIPALVRMIEEAGAIEHVDHVIGAAGEAAALELERASVERRVLGAPMATYREVERIARPGAGAHALDRAVLSFVLVTRTELDPLLDVPDRDRVASWTSELFPLRPEETLALDAFVSPEHEGASEQTLSAALTLEPLRGRRAA